jgi:hypothetical protein
MLVGCLTPLKSHLKFEFFGVVNYLNFNQKNMMGKILSPCLFFKAYILRIELSPMAIG